MSGDPDPALEEGSELDLRAAAVGAIAWATAFTTLTWSPWWVVAVLAVAGVAVLRRRRDAAALPTRAAWWLVAAAVGASAYLHLTNVTGSPVARLAHEAASVQVVATVGTSPVEAPGRFTDRVFFDATVTEVSSRGRHLRVRAPVLVLMDAGGRAVERGARVRLSGMLRGSDRPERAAVLTVRGDAVVLAGPGRVVGGSERVRRAVRDAVSGQPVGPRTLVPALVDGDDAHLPDRVASDFQVAGLTHLTTIKGTLKTRTHHDRWLRAHLRRPRRQIPCPTAPAPGYSCQG